MVTSKVATSTIPEILLRLQNGLGAQRLPDAVRSLEIVGVRSSGSRTGQRRFVKNVMPRLKYSNEHMKFNVEWIPQEPKIPGSKGMSKEQIKAVRLKEAVRKGVDANKKPSYPPFLARMTFDGMPPEELKLNKRGTELSITDEIFQRISAVTGQKVVAVHQVSTPTLTAQNLLGVETDTPEEAIDLIEEVQDAASEDVEKQSGPSRESDASSSQRTSTI